MLMSFQSHRSWIRVFETYAVARCKSDLDFRVFCLIVVIRFWLLSRLWHVSERLEVPLLYQQASSLTSLTWAHEKSIRSRPEPTANQTSLNRSCRTLQNASDQYKILSYQYIDPSRSHPRVRYEDLSESAAPTYLQLDSWIRWHAPDDSRIQLIC